MITFHAHARTHQGPVRGHNEDFVLLGRTIKNGDTVDAEFSEDDAEIRRAGFLAAVADGMGGHAAGETAARIALHTIDGEFHGSEKKGGLESIRRALEAAVGRANREILEDAAGSPALQGMGATVAGVALSGREYFVFHAGDSRVYRFRGGALRQLTQDDSLVALAVRAGQMTPEEALSSGMRHVITNGLGTEQFSLHVSEPASMKPGDALLICSDGLHDETALEKMEELLAGPGTLHERGALLMEAAMDSGGTDNISIVLVEAGPDGAETPAHG